VVSGGAMSAIDPDRSTNRIKTASAPSAGASARAAAVAAASAASRARVRITGCEDTAGLLLDLEDDGDLADAGGARPDDQGGGERARGLGGEDVALEPDGPPGRQLLPVGPGPAELPARGAAAVAQPVAVGLQ